MRNDLRLDGLDETERARALRLRKPADRSRYLSAHHLVRQVVGEWLGCSPDAVEFDRTCPGCGQQHGRPVVVAPVSRALSGIDPPAISLTHTGDLVGVALRTGRGLVGLDAEEPWEDDEPWEGEESQLEQMVRSPHDELTPGGRPVPLRTLWIRKEAVLKAAGVGLTVAMPQVGLTAHPGASGKVLRVLHTDATSPALADRSWWVVDVEAPGGYAAALAGDGTAPAITVIDRGSSASAWGPTDRFE